MGRPAHKPQEKDRFLVMFAKAAGSTDEQICQMIGVNSDTLRKYYSEELSNPEALLNRNVVGALYKNAMKGNVTAQIFWCKTKMGWREKSQLEVGGIDGAPILKLVLNREDESS